MNLLNTALAGVMLVIGTTVSAGAATPYVSASAGIAMLEDSDSGSGFTLPYDTGMAGALAAGIEEGYLRLEAEIGYQENGIEDSDDLEVAITTFMANGYYDLKLPLNPIKPYVTAGIGVADVNIAEFSSGDDSSMVLAGQVGIGAGFAVAPFVTLDARYRYLITTDAEFDDGPEKISIDSHNFMVGLRVGL
ncbi:MAG: outer membrane beta-barrel protein [Chlorobium sp.]|nr:outer membrane beta-barrel protein [Chlorobium sp.]MBN1278604.1 porin family protein [Chlorobiaceae bacterium]MCF8216697.1 outer membrane beta-barrel protein [Chlorobium sp.]MCF8271582.1 outer membrane beta-barrel protein [Chlorobium sp.]MCF8287937.1 outer membrane beta-barrel protein [Chlorobium sp.]MCF8291482.1 outer membrane beta-barrel protein [Chlorobium sp.]